MKILAMDASLTVIRTKEHAHKVLERVRKQGVPLVFDTGTSSKAAFTPWDNGEWSVWEPDSSWDIPVEFQPALRTDKEAAVNKLYQLRKHYNSKWKD